MSHAALNHLTAAIKNATAALAISECRKLKAALTLLREAYDHYHDAPLAVTVGKLKVARSLLEQAAQPFIEEKHES